MGIMLIINIIVHCIVLNKVMKPIKSKAKWKIQLTLWTVFLLTIVTATYNYSMVTYFISKKKHLESRAEMCYNIIIN